MKIKNIILLVGAVAFGSLFAEVVVDDKLPAGNIIVLKASEGKVELRQDQRDTKGEKWFYWAFRVKGAAGKTITFEVPFANANGAVVTPEICRDLGRDVAKVWKELLQK